MWVFCCGMQRYGSTVQYQLTAEIVESKGVGRRLGWVEPQQFLELRTSYMGEKGLLVVKCHSYIEDASDLFAQREAKAIYVYRDVRDVVISIMNKNKVSFWHIVQSNFIESILEEYFRWNKVNDILISKYETMVTDLRQGALKIAGYLGVDLDEASASKIAEKYTIDQQMQRIQSFNYENLGMKVGASVYDPVSLLHSNHIHSGKSEQWRTALSCFQVGLIENIAYDWLVDKGYPISQNYIIRKIAAIRYLFLRTVLFPHLIGQRAKKLLLHKLGELTK